MLDSLRFHHIGYAVRDLLTTAGYYTGAGWTTSEIYCDKIQNAQIALLSKKAFPLIELVAPVDENSPIVKTLNKMEITPYHVCYETDDIEQSVAALKKQHFLPLFKPVEAIAFGNRKICYLYHQHVGLIELLNK